MRISYLSHRSRPSSSGYLLLFINILLAVFMWDLASSHANMNFVLFDASHTFIAGLLCCLTLICRLMIIGEFSYRLISLICIWLLVSIIAAVSISASQLAFALQAVWWLLLLPIALRISQKKLASTPALFLVLLAVLVTTAIGQLFFSTHLASVQNDNYLIAAHLAKATVLICALLVSSITTLLISPSAKRALPPHQLRRFNKTELALLVSAIVATSCFILGYFFTLPVSAGVLMIGVGILHFVRVGYWAFIKQVTASIWLLKLTYLMMANSLVLLGLSYFYSQISFDLALHLMVISLIGQTGLTMFISISQAPTTTFSNRNAPQLWLLLLLPLTASKLLFHPFAAVSFKLSHSVF